MSLPSPTSPQEGLRRRGKLSTEESWPGEASTSKQPISPVRHRSRALSAASDSFGDFIDSGYSLERDIRVRSLSESNAEIDDDWQDADLVQSFSPVASAKDDAFPAPGPSAPLNALDWDAWETPRGPTPQPNTTKGNITDDTFFDAFEKATLSQQRRPSPPIIDLRDMERKLERNKEAKKGLHTKDLDFFDSFEQRPEQVMMTSREKAEGNASLKGAQLESMTEAQSSPMNIITPSGRQPSGSDYFAQDLMMNSPDDSFSKNNEKDVELSHSQSDSWSEAAGNWAGTFRKTLGTLRGQAVDLAQHLPSAKDFIVPEGEEDDEEGEGESEMNGDNGVHEEKVTKIPSRRIARASDYSQSSPFGTSSGSHPASPPLQLLSRNGSARAPPISGAPGFNPNPVHNWNTGSWRLSSSDEMQRNKKPIHVELKGRREETQDVMGEKLAAHLTAQLPKRLQLGKSWKLLYSSDQHGISLGTLYWKVQSGLEVSKNGQSIESMGLQDAEGWLRGASQATQEAVTGVKRIGGGLQVSEAGLIVAIRDSEDHIFGAYINERLRAQSGYYGNGECFLWKATSESEAKTFQWTGRNDYMILTEAHYLSFGGGDGKYGLWLDGQLEKGISAKCPAFDNDVLCCSASTPKQEGHFECITLEVWACGID